MFFSPEHPGGSKVPPQPWDSQIPPLRPGEWFTHTRVHSHSLSLSLGLRPPSPPGQLPHPTLPPRQASSGSRHLASESRPAAGRVPRHGQVPVPVPLGFPCLGGRQDPRSPRRWMLGASSRSPAGGRFFGAAARAPAQEGQPRRRGRGGPPGA